MPMKPTASAHSGAVPKDSPKSKADVEVNLHESLLYSGNPRMRRAFLQYRPDDDGYVDQVWAYMMHDSIASYRVYPDPELAAAVDMKLDRFNIVLDLPGSLKHALIKRGMPTRILTNFVDQKFKIGKQSVFHSLGFSDRTIRRKTEAQLLSSQHTDAAFALMEVTQLAAVVLGDRDAAEEWLTSPEVGLDNQRPIDLLSTYPGTESVKTLLNRIRFGVYA